MARADGSMLDVLVATPGGGTGQGGIDRVMASLRDEAIRQRRPDLKVQFGDTRGMGPAVFSVWYTLVFMARMFAMRLAGKVDVLHLNLSVNGSTWRKWAIAVLARLLGVPYVLHLHSSGYPTFWTDAPTWKNRRINSLFNHAQRIIVLGTVWRDFVLSRLPGLADRVVIVPNASPRPALQHRGGGDTVHVLFLGRVNANKGVPQLGEALHRLKDNPNWRATIAGDGFVEDARATAAAMGLSGRVDIPGWMGPDDVARLLSEADILVLPSFNENLPVSVIEGMASALAVVATPVGAVGDIITNDVSGLLVEPGDVEALTEALRRLIDDAELRRRLGAAAQAEHRRRLDMELYLKTLGDIWSGASRSRQS